MLLAVTNNYKMINPLPTIWWLIIGYIAQYFYPETLLNYDNMSVTTFQTGVSLSVLIALLSLFIASIFYQDKPNESSFLRFLYSSSKQFSELAMAVFGFSAAYFFHKGSGGFACLLVCYSLVLATAMNHIFLVVFNENKVGTLKLTLDLDEKFKKEFCTKSAKVVSGLIALGTLTFVASYLLGS